MYHSHGVLCVVAFILASLSTMLVLVSGLCLFTVDLMHAGEHFEVRIDAFVELVCVYNMFLECYN